MAFNKNKALESALKYLNQGKVAQAISEYRQILRHDAKDQATLMTVGDLYARQGDMPNAIEYFERLAQVYLTDGFNSKAIAIYKKIAKLAPNELAPLERLADLYVQQGVLSEARPLYLQIAEAHLKANHAPKAVEVLHRLLEVEPESPRVQMRLAELYNVLGQKKEAADTYLNYAQRLLERGEPVEAEKLAERAIAVDSSNPVALLLKGKAFLALNKTNEAIAAFEKHPEADAGGEITNLIVDTELRAGRLQQAADRARTQLLRGSSHYIVLHRVADAMIESGEVARALPLLAELRDPMIEASEQEKYAKSLTNAAERLPGDPAPLQTLVDFCRTTGDPFRLNSALTQLADIYSSMGDYARAEGIVEELIERNKDDERLGEKLSQIRARKGGKQEPLAPAPAAVSAIATTGFVELHPEPEPKTEAETASEHEVPPLPEEVLDEETQKFIAQALTDVDLFSSYGLTQKATHLLETVLERAPRHTPTIERLLDFYLGAGNERRTAELASQLEQIYTQRGDSHNAERFAELRIRFQTAAGMSEDELPAAPALPTQPAASNNAGPALQEPAPAQAAHPAAAPAPLPQLGPAEFEIAVVPMQEEHEAAPQQSPMAAPAASASPANVVTPVEAGEEVDLSDEWEAMLKDVEEPAAASVAEEAIPQALVAEKKPSAEPSPEFAVDIASQSDNGQSDSDLAAALAEGEELDPIVAPSVEAEAAPASAAPTEEPDFELVEQAKTGEGAQTADDLINELAAEFDAPPAAAAPAPHAGRRSAPAPEKQRPVASPGVASSPREMIAPPPASSEPQVSVEALNQLTEVFQEFRAEIGEDGADESEDLETHYNLGIAYREMGLLDEAIGEFQKVAKAVQKGKPFAYAMNCSTLLALSFSDKGEPKIAALWYQRALDTPGLDQEAELALLYDLGLALEQAGDSDAALDSFRQVYAMNIDYRDVADRIATLQRH